jgi:hypothetical protein
MAFAVCGTLVAAEFDYTVTKSLKTSAPTPLVTLGPHIPHVSPPHARRLSKPIPAPAHGCDLCCHCPGGKCSDTCKPLPPIEEPPKVTKPYIVVRDCSHCPGGTCHLGCGLPPPGKRDLEERNCNHLCCGLTGQALADCEAAQFPASPVKRHHTKPTLPLALAQRTVIVRAVEKRNCQHLCCGLTGKALEDCLNAEYGGSPPPQKRSPDITAVKRHHTKPTLPLALAQPTAIVRALQKKNCQHMCCGLTGKALEDCLNAQYGSSPPQKRSPDITAVRRDAQPTVIVRSVEKRNCQHMCCGLTGKALEDCLNAEYGGSPPQKRSPDITAVRRDAQPTVSVRALEKKNCLHMCCGLTGKALEDCLAAQNILPKKRSEVAPAQPTVIVRSLEKKNCLHLCCGLTGQALLDCLAATSGPVP